MSLLILLIFFLNFKLLLSLLEIGKLHLVIKIVNTSFTCHVLVPPEQPLLLLQLICHHLFSSIVDLVESLSILNPIPIFIFLFIVLIRAKEVTLTKLITIVVRVPPLHLMHHLLLLLLIHTIKISDISIKFMRPVVITAAMLLLPLLPYLLQVLLVLGKLLLL